MARKNATKQKSFEERSLRKLIRRSTAAREWGKVQFYFNELGELFEQEERDAITAG